MLQTYFSYPPQLIPGPDSAHRILGIAKHHQRYLRIGSLLLQRVEIHTVSVTHTYQFCRYCLAAVLLERDEEMVVGGGLDQHLASLRHVGGDRSRQGRNDSCDGQYPFSLDLPAVSGFKPAYDSIVVSIRYCSIAVNAVLRPLYEGFAYRLCCNKIHISHPERQHFRFRTGIPFEGTCSPSGDYTVKIVSHKSFLIKYNIIRYQEGTCRMPHG